MEVISMASSMLTYKKKYVPEQNESLIKMSII